MREFVQKSAPVFEGASFAAFLEVGSGPGKQGLEERRFGLAGSEKGGKCVGIAEGKKPWIILSKQARGSIVPRGYNGGAGDQGLSEHGASPLL